MPYPSLTNWVLNFMSISLGIIKQVSEVDHLIKIAERDQRTLDARKKSLQVRAANSTEDFNDNASELATAQAKLAAANTIIATLQDGPDKEDEITKKLELELKIRKLSTSTTRLDAETIVEREYDVELIDAQLLVITNFITQLQALKATL